MMPTPGGLPKRGEVWESTRTLPGQETHTTRFVVLERGRGDYWSMRVFIPGKGPGKGKQLWVDPAYQMKMGELKYIGPAGPETRKKLGL
jgi:hypothetical protein